MTWRLLLLLENFNKSTIISLVFIILTSLGLSCVINLVACHLTVYFSLSVSGLYSNSGPELSRYLRLDGHGSVFCKLGSFRVGRSPGQGQSLSFLS